MYLICWKLLSFKYTIDTAIYNTFIVWWCNVWLVLVLYFAGKRSWISTTDPAWPPTVQPLVTDLWPSTSPPTFVRTLYRSLSTGPAFKSQPLSHCKSLCELLFRNTVFGQKTLIDGLLCGKHPCSFERVWLLEMKHMLDMLDTWQIHVCSVKYFQWYKD